MNSLQKYLQAFTSLRRGSTKFGVAPHKPVLLMAFLEMFEKGMIMGNRVEVDADLVGTFQDMWQLLVPTLHQADFTQPFYYMQNEKAGKEAYWSLVPKPGYSINSHIRSVNSLQEVLDYGCFAEDLFVVLSDPYSRALLRNGLLQTYFPDTKERYKQKKRISYVQELESYILNEPIEPIKRIKVGVEEEVYVRNGFFKKLVPKVYNSTCSFTGMKLTSTHGYNMVDACHIVPFSVSQDDRVTNGLALCPNLHRAFDRGLVSIDENYKVLLSDHLVEDEDHPYSLQQLKGKEIQLPREKRFFPSEENLEWHRERVFKR